METVSINQFRQNPKRFVGRVVAEHSPVKVRNGDEEIAVVFDLNVPWLRHGGKPEPLKTRGVIR